MNNQEIMNKLIWQHGNNLPNWANYNKILMEEGLNSEDVTEEMIIEAKHQSSIHLEREFINEPEKPETDVEFGFVPLTYSNEGNVMQVQKEAAIDLLVALGKVKAKNWSPRRITTKLNNLAKTLDGAKEPEGKDLTLLRQISKSLQNGESIEVVEQAKVEEVESKNDEVKVSSRKIRKKRSFRTIPKGRLSDAGIQMSVADLARFISSLKSVLDHSFDNPKQ